MNNEKGKEEEAPKQETPKSDEEHWFEGDSEEEGTMGYGLFEGGDPEEEGTMDFGLFD